MEVLHTQIRLYAEQGKADEAIRLCDQIVAQLHNASAYALRAQVYVTLKLSTQRQYALKPYDPKQYEKTLRDLDEKALADFGQIIALDPQKAEGWAARADFYRVSGRVREGITDIRKALELAPDNLAFQKLAALLLIASGESSLLERSRHPAGQGLGRVRQITADQRGGATDGGLCPVAAAQGPDSHVQGHRPGHRECPPPLAGGHRK